MPSSRWQIWAIAGAFVVGDREGRAARRGAVDEEAHRVVLPQRAAARRSSRAAVHDSERHSPRHLARDSERLAAGRQHAQRPRAAPRARRASSAQASRRCSQLSSTSSVRSVRQRWRSAARRAGARERDALPSRRATADRDLGSGRPRWRAPRTTRRPGTGRRRSAADRECEARLAHSAGSRQRDEPLVDDELGRSRRRRAPDRSGARAVRGGCDGARRASAAGADWREAPDGLPATPARGDRGPSVGACRGRRDATSSGS